MLNLLPVVLFSLLLATACARFPGKLKSPADPQGQTNQPPVVNAWHHDPQAFTQGLAFSDGYLYESTGLYGASSLRRVDPATGAVLKSVAVPAQYFGEGMTILKGKIYQLTWREHRCLVYEKASMRMVGEFAYEGEGWGLANDGENLILSDGTDVLRVYEPASFKLIRRLGVRENGLPVINLDELEYIRGEIYAVIWMSDRIVRIDPASGKVISGTTLRHLYPPEQRPSEEADLNGIAYDSTLNRILVTGKLWPRLFEITMGGQEEPPRPSIARDDDPIAGEKVSRVPNPPKERNRTHYR